MKSIFRATAVLSSSSIISILLGLVSSKVMAVYLQPQGYGYYGLLQSFVSVASLVAGMGIATGLVRMGAGAVTRGDQLTISSLRSASWWLCWLLGGLAVLAVGLFRAPISRWVIGSSAQADTILWMAIALVFTVAAGVMIGTLNAYHRVNALAKYSVTSTFLTAGAGILAVVIFRVRGIIPAIIGGAAISWAVAGYFLRREVGPAPIRPARQNILREARSLLRFGGSYTASMLVGTGVQLALPILVLHLLGPESVGYYKAAAAISVGYLGFMVTAMAQDYYPRVSAVAGRPDALVELMNEQHKLVMMLAVPMIIGMLALVPYLVPLLYSNKFMPAVGILEWQLIGDLFKFSSWTMSFVILACCRSSIFFLSEAVSGVVNLVATWLAVRWFGLSGLGISFLATYIIYYAVVWLIVRRQMPLAWTWSNKKMMLAAMAAALVIRILPSTALAGVRSVIALLFAVMAGAWSLYSLREQLGGVKATTTLRRIAEKV